MSWRRTKRRWRKRLRRVATPTGVLVLLAAVLGVAVGATAAWSALSDEPVSVRVTGSPAAPLEPDDFTHLGGGADLAELRAEVTSKKPLTISVLGDSTGNAPDEWVYLWAQHLAETRAVTYHAWDDVALEYLPPVTLSSDGPRTVVWNGSAAGRPSEYPATRLRKMQPVEPDVVIYNFGHNDNAASLDRGLFATASAVEKRWGDAVPSVVTLQNPQRGATAEKHANTVDWLRSAIAPALGMPTIDVWSAFEKDGRSLTVLVSNADGYGVHPTPTGSQVWARAVVAALG